MQSVWRRLGTGLWVVMALVGVVTMSLVLWATLGTTKAEPEPEERLMRLMDFQPRYASGDVLVVDVRDEDSYANGHIVGAIHVPLREVEQRLSEVRDAAGKRLVVTYCACPSEGTSLLAANRLMEAGVPAKALVGGYRRWVEFGGAVEPLHPETPGTRPPTQP
jgi:rhodanese-related sulfurtransferase